MKKMSFLFILFSIFMIGGCGAPAQMEADPEGSSIRIEEDRNLFTIYARLLNTGSRTSDELYATFVIHDERLIQELGTDMIVFGDREGPIAFTINGNGSYFISETFEVSTVSAIEDWSNSIEIIISTSEQEPVTRFFIETVEVEGE